MWAKTKAFFRYGNRIKKSTDDNKSTKKDGASVLFEKMVTSDKPTDKIKTKEKTNSSYTKEKMNKRVQYNKSDKIKGSNNKRVKVHSVPSKKENRQYNSAIEKKQAAIQDNYKGPTCPYCGGNTVIKTAKEHTNNDENYCYWVCGNCNDVSVTTVKGGYLPSGIPANAETRKLRVNAHRYLYSKKQELKFNNNALNKWMSDSLSIDVNRAWIGRLDKSELINIILIRQDEIYQEEHSDIFNKIN